MFRGNLGWLAATVILVLAGTWLYGTPPLLAPPATPPVKANTPAATTPLPLDEVADPDDFTPPLLPAPLESSPPSSNPTPPQPVGEFVPATPASIRHDSTVQELLQLRERIGSPLKGTALDDSEDSSFEEFLRRAIASEPDVTKLDLNQDGLLEEPMALEAPATPGAVEQLRAAASALDRHSDQLQSELPARSRRLRALANQLRQEADEIQELHE